MRGNCTPQEGFNDLITNSISAQDARQTLTKLYINYTRLSIKYGDGLEIREIDDELALLRDMISLFDGTYEV